MVRGNGIKRSETIETGFPCLRYGEIYTSFDVILDKPRSFVPKELFDRSVKIKKGDLCYQLFIEHGFSWGGNWRTTKDYQHFEKDVK